MAVHTIGFVGLGIMGGPMAANLVRAGFDVVGYNRSRGKVDRLVEAGGHGASSAAEPRATATSSSRCCPTRPTGGVRPR